MSEDFSSAVRVGYFLRLDEAVKPFLVRLGELKREEPRFNQKTGASLPSVSVLVREAGYYVKLPGSFDVEGVPEVFGPLPFDDGAFTDVPEEAYEGEANENLQDFFARLANFTGCEVEEFGGSHTKHVGFSVDDWSKDHVDDSFDVACHVSNGMSIPICRMLDLRGKAIVLRGKLEQLGYQGLFEPLVYNPVWTSN